MGFKNQKYCNYYNQKLLENDTKNEYMITEWWTHRQNNMTYYIDLQDKYLPCMI